MYLTLLGEEGFQKGMTLYWQRHDGSAATCDDFRAAMADANGADLAQFERWYTQAGTPEVTARGTHDAAGKTYTLTLSQATPPTPSQPDKARRSFRLISREDRTSGHAPHHIRTVESFRDFCSVNSFLLRHANDCTIMRLYCCTLH